MSFFKKITFLFLLVSYSLLGQTTVYNEDFDKKGTWPTGNNENRELNVYNGRYYFEHKRTEKSWRISSSSFNINQSKDFDIETSIQKISGVGNSGIAFYYDYKDDNNFRELGIATNGYYRVSEAKEGKYNNLKKWTKSSSVKSGNYGVNKLKISKRGNLITLYINNSQVYSENFSPFMGKKLGIAIYANQKISIDYFKVTQKSSYTKTDYTNNNFNNKNNGYKTKTIIYDSFYSNKNNWGITNTSTAKLEIKNGKYYFEYTGKKGWTTTKSFSIDTQRDFKVESSIQKISGIRNNGFGLVLGREDSKNQYQFLITANGSFAIDLYENGQFKSLVDWTETSAIKKQNFSTNTLKFEKRGNNFVFFINNTKVHTAYNLQLFGKRYGFVVFDPQKISIDDINIAYLNSNGGNNKFNINTNRTKGDVVFEENFYDNSNAWTEQDNENTRFRVSNGKYYVQHKPTTRGWSTNIKKPFTTGEDFEIETKLDKVSGVTNNAYGLMWGLGNNSSFRFYIASSGYYKVARVVDGKEEIIVKWSKTSAVNQNNGASNILRVRKENDYYKFYVNDRYLTKTDFEEFFGDRIGFVVFNNQEIAVDYLKINRLEKTDNNTNTYVNNKTLTVPLNDTFSNNSSGWQLEDADDYSVALSNNKLILHRKKKGGIFISRSVDINTSKDFIIETSISRVTNSINGFYGITFGRKNSANEYSFLLSGNGTYMYRKFENGKYHKIIPFTETSALKTGRNLSNKIKIVKSGNLLRFFINDQYVNETPFEPFFGNKLGYSIYYDKKIAIDYLNVKYQNSTSFNNPPVVVITSPNVELKRGFKIVEAKKILVKGTATDADGIYEITVNGVEAQVSGDGTFMANIPLKYGKNDLVVKATDMKQSSSTKTFTIKRKSPDLNIVDNTNINASEKLNVGNGKYYALIIGVSEYDDDKIQDLNGEPTKDAQNLADVLVSKYSFNRENVTVLKNPKENQIIREFYKLQKKVTNKDNVVIFYAGHGNYDEASEKGYWMPSDAEMEFEGNVILNTSIVTYIKAIKSRHTLLIADACFSGSILVKERAFKDASKAVNKKYSLPSRRAITSGTLTTVPNESVFMKYLLKRLKENNSKYLAAGQLFNMIEDPVINNTTGDNQPQYAPISRTGDEGGDFIFIRKN